MLSFLSSIKNKIRDKLAHRRLLNRSERYRVVMESDVIDIDVSSTPDTLSNTGDDTVNPTPPPPTPVKTQRLFEKDIDVESDYELQCLLLRTKHSCVDLASMRLETRFEEIVENIPNVTEIFRIKMRLLYIIIALNCYSDFFEEKKKYCSLKTKYPLGVFRYNDYIIRIDDSPYSFMNENDVSSAFTTSAPTNIILPFLTYTNIKKNEKNNICECETEICECKYRDNADHYDKINEMSYEGQKLYTLMRTNVISFSIQHYVKNTEQLYHWVKDNIGNNIYNQFSNIQYPFFIELFLKCALALRELHTMNIVHGDIKPDNILIREHDNFILHHFTKYKNFTVYMIDFGLSGIHNEGFGTGGTIPYCHPEFKNIRDTNKTGKYNWKRQKLKHDVWSLGILFITLYIYRDFYNYYYKYPNYFFTKERYVSSLILDVIADMKLHVLFTKMLSEESISIHEVCELLEKMIVK